MTKVVNGTTVIVEELDEVFLVQTLFYDDGRVVLRRGGEDWIQIKDADKFVLEVGICTKCGRMICADEEWEFPKGKPETVWHTYDEDCTKKNEADDEDN